MQQVFLDKKYNDRFCVHEYGIPNLLLMENAGGNLARFIAKKCKKKSHKSKVVFLCGSGDNGADGLVGARILNALLPHIHILVVLLKEPQSELCKMQLDILKKIIRQKNKNSATQINSPANNILQKHTNGCGIDIIEYYDFLEWIKNDRTISYQSKNEFIQNLQKLFQDSATSTKNKSLFEHFFLFCKKFLDKKNPILSLCELEYQHNCNKDLLSDCERIYTQKLSIMAHRYYQACQDDILLPDIHYQFLHKILQSLNTTDIVIDCIFGSGFDNQKRNLQAYSNYLHLRNDLNATQAIKIACDMPSGLPNILGHNNDIDDILTNYHYTFCMGALSLSLLDSRIKDTIGKIKISNLGISQERYCDIPTSQYHRNISSNKQQHDKENTLREERNMNNQETNKKDFVSESLNILQNSTIFLLNQDDINLPLRITQNAHKGSYGTAYIISGEMEGASLLSAKAAQAFGAGKTCLCTNFLQDDTIKIIKDSEIIYTKTSFKQYYTHNLMKNSKDSDTQQSGRNAFGVGMGLGYDDCQYNNLFGLLYELCGITGLENKNIQDLLQKDLKIQQDSIQKSFTEKESCYIDYKKAQKNKKSMIENLIDIQKKQFCDTKKAIFSNYSCEIPIVFDADILYRKEIIPLLSFFSEVVITPHPKEFLALLQNIGLLHESCKLDFILRNIPLLALQFSGLFPHVVCLIKGANTIIVFQNMVFIHTLGSSNLAKGGSGDVLSGMIVALLAQGYNSFEACKQASLVHALAGQNALKKWQSYALSPMKLIKSLEQLWVNKLFKK
ncbi:hypothetical protein CQA53_02440 [Helicobacter didelphidarum]|uniref:ADP-dependent (S)-NAD(P)H-hydrate dehydratase n=1 Tax=Helicobacter didelphidarum TaxID=2040648 RepID=A0A3D8IPF9_9HELI|nr:bifunctional ADP-dependent NAD(P)H-hydrate dehydratase/NAD(P)H-hydrate epimerase [Helicobacter didelphidarum]RDU67129.1 hypothetical protein CQA53_02440 [Helicobacter didelphidarum]